MINRVRIKVEGLNAYKIIDKLIDDGVLIENYITQKKSILFDVNEKDEYLVKKICSLYHKKYQIVSRYNLLNFFRRLRYYFGSVLAILFCCCFVLVNNLYIYKIDFKVEGNFFCNLNEIKSLLRENGIYEGLQKKKIKTSEIEKIILSSKQIAGCSVSKNGGCLDIVLYPGILKNENNQENLYSKFDAVILDVDVYAGIAKVKKGDVVRVGDLLVENNNGACGKILAKIYFSDYILYNENQIEEVKTGNFYIEKDILIFNKNLTISRKNSKYQNFIEEYCAFSISNNLFVPVSVVEKKYCEIEYKDVIVKFDDKEKELKRDLLDIVQETIPDKETITNVTYSVVVEGGLTRLDCFVECEIDLLV